MKLRHLIFWTLCCFFAGAVAAACGADGGGPPGPVPSMRITNKSQFLLNELRVHGSDGYLQTMNVLPEPMEIDSEVLFYGEGQRWITVLRQKAERAEVLAFTTGEPLFLYRNQGYRLTVFDDSFRFDDDTYVRPDRYDGVIVGDPGPMCEWAPTSSTARCPNN